MENFQINIYILPWKRQIIGEIGLPLIPLELLGPKQFLRESTLDASKKSSLYPNCKFGILTEKHRLFSMAKRDS